MAVITAEQRLQGDIENICQMAVDDIEGALWVFTRNKAETIKDLRSAIDNINVAIALLEGKP